MACCFHGMHAAHPHPPPLSDIEPRCHVAVSNVATIQQTINFHLCSLHGMHTTHPHPPLLSDIEPTCHVTDSDMATIQQTTNDQFPPALLPAQCTHGSPSPSSPCIQVPCCCWRHGNQMLNDRCCHSSLSMGWGWDEDMVMTHNVALLLLIDIQVVLVMCKGLQTLRGTRVGVRRVLRVQVRIF